MAGARLNSAAEGNKPLHDIYAYHSLGLVFNFGGDGGSSYNKGNKRSLSTHIVC